MKLASIVLCAGKGTRMKSEQPKVLHPAAGRAMGAWPLRAARQAGADPLIAVVGHEADAVKAALTEDLGEGLRFALQPEQRGTGHAVQCGLPALPDDAEQVLILYGDTPLLRAETLSALAQARVAADVPLAMLTTTLADPTGYGRVLTDDDGRPTAVVEQRDADEAQRAITLVNPGIYVVEAGFLRDGLSRLDDDNAQGELYLTDLVAMAHDAGGAVAHHVAADETLGVNDRAQLAQASGELYARIRQRWMVAGVTMLQPETTIVDDSVELEADVTLGPGVSLHGDTRVAGGAWIHAGCVLRDTVVEAGAQLHPYSVCEEASVGRGCSVGPFARLRPAARLEEGSKVGNYVEVKKTTLGKGSKANHLAYLGDSVIGEGVNVGAGTITCNYDGFGKHKTELGDGVFIGSNSTLVAPLKVEPGAYVAAGSTVSRDVPAGALAISRGRQENKEGYADRLRSRMKARAGKK
jgi:bifunctional UDP-N-acetylglucosamine pyrophosphorylase/glucosamine-1-phosphate N-acetyltransferase